MGREIFGPQKLSLNEVATFATHGGALDAARRLFPRAPLPWIDLSTGINPIAYPVGAMDPAVLERLPEEADRGALEEAAAYHYRAPLGSAVVAAPGTQALIQHLPALCDGRDVRVLDRRFAESERVFGDADRIVRTVPRAEALSGADVAVVVNPNNPDGRLLPVTDLVKIADRVGTLIVDEAFVDALPPSQSIVPQMPLRRTIVLRSFGKIYGLAGLRLGFAIVSAERGSALRRWLGPWAVSGPALSIGMRTLADESWLDAARARLATDGARLMFLLRHIGVTLVGGTPLFRLVAHPAAPALFTALAEAGILTRPFSGELSWLRFGFPGNEHGWARLDDTLQAFR